jgi:negative regulator of flagellin synthesis FlgM
MPISQVNTNDRLRATMAAAAMRSKAAYGAQSTAAPTRQPDAMSLSETAQALASARKKIADAPEVREDRIQALKAAISSGSYSVSSRDLAQAMLRSGAI